MSKPKEFAHKLRHRFGSADNLPTLVEKEPAKESKNPMGSSSLPRDNPGSRGPAMFVAEHQSSYDEDEAVSRFRSTVASEKSDATSESVPHCCRPSDTPVRAFDQVHADVSWATGVCEVPL